MTQSLLIQSITVEIHKRLIIQSVYYCTLYLNLGTELDCQHWIFTDSFCDFYSETLAACRKFSWCLLVENLATLCSFLPVAAEAMDEGID